MYDPRQCDMDWMSLFSVCLFFCMILDRGMGKCGHVFLFLCFLHCPGYVNRFTAKIGPRSGPGVDGTDYREGLPLPRHTQDYIEKH